MAAYRGKSRQIKDALVVLLTAIQRDTGSGAEPAFTSVTSSPAGQFKGYPSVRVLPGDVLTEKKSTNQNERTVTLLARVHLPMENLSTSALAAQFDAMYDLTDLIIDTLDQGDATGAMNVAEPTLGTLILNAERGDWMELESPGGVLLACDVAVQVRYSRNFN